MQNSTIYWIAKLMRITLIQATIAMTLCGIALARDNYGQGILDREITAKYQGVSLKKVLSSIEKKTSIKFAYSGSFVNLQDKVTLDVKEKRLAEVLEKLLKPRNISYEERNDYIVLTQAKVEAAASTGEKLQNQAESGETLVEIASQSAVEDIVITGTVTAKDGGLPIPGVNVIIKGTTIGSITDKDGHYTIRAADGNGVLVFSFVGYETREISINNRSAIDVTMTPDVTTMQEIVVVGYGTQRKSDVTGAVASVSRDRIENMVTTDFVQLVQGAVAGLNVTATAAGSDPSSGATFLIRGRNSISASNDPLLVLDGVPYYGSLSDINTGDIESIEVLKDASSSAIYGSRGSNGVILIETRKGSKGKPTVRYNGFYSVQSVANFPHLMTGEEYYNYKVDWANTANDDEELPLTDAELDVYNSGSYKSFTWKDLILRKGSSQRHDLSVSGGSDKTTYNVSLSYLGTKGIVINDRYRRGTSRINVKSDVNNWLTIGTNTMLAYTDNSGATPSFVDMFNKSPLAVPFNPDGSVNIFPIADDPRKINPIETLLYDDLNRKYAVSSNNYLNIDLPFVKGLSYRLNTGFQLQSSDRNWYRGTNTNKSGDLKGESEMDHGNRYSYTIENIFAYNRAFGKHNLFLTGLFSMEEREEKHSIVNAEGFANDFLSWYGSPQANKVTPSYTYLKTDMVSQMFRANYAYDSRYLLTATVRRDGYSGFGTNKKYGVFPSLAVGWNIAKEEFFNNASTRIDMLKLRVSFGESGNQAISPYQTLSQLGKADYIDGDVSAPGYVPVTLGTAGLGWESTRSLNVGMDYGLFESRITGEINLYRNQTKDLLLKRAISAVHGVNYVFQNIGKTENEGLEFMVNSANVRTSNFSWSSNVNFAFIKTQILDLYGDGNDDIANRWFIGQPINVNYDYKFIGVWQLDEEAVAAEYGALPGYAKYEDLNGNGVYDPDDRQLIGSPEPNFTWGVTNTFNYRNFGLSIFMYGKHGIEKANPYKDRSYLIQQDYWTPENPTNEYWSNASQATRYMGKGNYPSVYENADFMRIKDITLSYFLSQGLSDKIKIHNARIYVSGKNLFTITNWGALDPELDNQRAIPLQREYIVGLDLSF